MADTRQETGVLLAASAESLPWNASNSGTYARLRGVASGAGRLVTVGIGGVVLTSENAATWVTGNSAEAHTLLDVTHSGTEFMAVGESGTLVTSPDGVNWTTRPSGVTDDLGGVIWADQQFVVVGGSYQANGTREVILTSPDGVEWTTRHSAMSGWLNAVTWSGSQFVAVGSGSLWTSVDGVSWVNRSIGDAYQLRGVATGGGCFVAVGYSREDGFAAVITSSDGVNWTRTYTGHWNYLNRVAWTGDQFVVVGEEGLILTSADGTGWQTSPVATSQDLFGIVSDGKRVVAVGHGGTILSSFLRLGDSPVITTSPQSHAVPAGGTATFVVTARGNGDLSYQWRRNGVPFGTSSATLTLADVQPPHAGVYDVVVVDSSGATKTAAALLGIVSTAKVLGDGITIDSDVPHPNGKIFDQVLVTGFGSAITADWSQGQVTRTSFIDLDDDIVQVEFSGPGTLTLVLDGCSAPAGPVNYSQAVDYVKGHAGIVITGADERTNVTVFTVGRATAFDPTGAYDILEAPSTTNDPAKNGSPLFVGHAATNYDGIADIAYIAISSTNGRFGGVRTANAHYFASKGLTGVYAPGVTFQGPLYVGDVSAFDSALPVLITGSVSDARIAGGDLLQDNDAAVAVSGINQLVFTAGITSAGTSLPVRPNQARLEQDGVDVTQLIVVNPTP